MKHLRAWRNNQMIPQNDYDDVSIWKKRRAKSLPFLLSQCLLCNKFPHCLTLIFINAEWARSWNFKSSSRAFSEFYQCWFTFWRLKGCDVSLFIHYANEKTKTSPLIIGKINVRKSICFETIRFDVECCGCALRKDKTSKRLRAFDFPFAAKEKCVASVTGKTENSSQFSCLSFNI